MQHSTELISRLVLWAKPSQRLQNFCTTPLSATEVRAARCAHWSLLSSDDKTPVLFPENLNHPMLRVNVSLDERTISYTISQECALRAEAEVIASHPLTQIHQVVICAQHVRHFPFISFSIINVGPTCTLAKDSFLVFVHKRKRTAQIYLSNKTYLGFLMCIFRALFQISRHRLSPSCCKLSMLPARNTTGNWLLSIIFTRCHLWNGQANVVGASWFKLHKTKVHSPPPTSLDRTG